MMGIAQLQLFVLSINKLAWRDSPYKIVISNLTD
jgi:hypothetical protein